MNVFVSDDNDNSPLAFAYSNVYDRPLQPLCFTPTLSATYQQNQSTIFLEGIRSTFSNYLRIHFCPPSVPLRV